MKKIFNWLKNEESGQGMVEYGLLLVFISIVAIASLILIGPKIAKIFTDTNTALPS